GRRGSPLEFTIIGPDRDRQRELFKEFEKRASGDPRIVGLRSDDVHALPEIHIIPDRKTAIASGVEIAEIARIVNTTFGGITADQYTQGGRRFDILVQLEEKGRQKASDLGNVLVRNNRGE